MAQFNELMRTFAVATCNEIEVGHTGYLDRPVAGKLFAGKDDHGRVFVNLPLYIDESPTMTAMRTANGRRKSNSEGFVFFQRYTDNQNKFVVGGLRFPLMRDIMGADSKDLTNLTRILNGETVRFYEHTYTDGVDVRDDAVWIDVSMQPL